MAGYKIDHKKRLEVEDLIYRAFDADDKSGYNTEYYRNILSKMTDEEFYKFMSRRLPFRYQLSTFKNEPKMADAIKAFKVIGKPLLERLNCPFIYVNDDGVPIKTKGEALVIYLNTPRMKQMRVKKNNTAIDINHRDMRTGMLLGHDKGGRMSDREYGSLGAVGSYNTMDEFSTFRADAMKAKAEAYNRIMQTGVLSKEDVSHYSDDRLGKNLMNAYLIGCNFMSNLVCTDYMTPRTLEMKNQTKALKRD